ncbi:hypothetical protein ACJMK2_035315 [Sinanodonta woodiana]|uniref:BD-FAE-like domain-containing protein n=1 Tax=Sinanodonta woodiana TaxID=1069815 RepID=A0ABD3WVU1_SINWO
MFRSLVKSLAILATLSVAIPYASAFVCNFIGGWPQTKNRFRRAFNPRKVYSLNYALLQKLMIALRYAPLYFQWRRFYKKAGPHIVVKDIPYGRNDKMLDIYFPYSHSSNEKASYPVVLFVYGGAWGSGDKDMYGLLCHNVSNKLNVIVCCPNLSIYPQGYVDDMIQDVVDSVSWTFDNIRSLGGNRNKIMLVGHSSGAHLCAMTVLELLHDELVQTGSSQKEPVLARSIRFEEQHFTGRHASGDNSRQEKLDTLEVSSASSGSFCVVNDTDEKGAASTDFNNAASMFEVLNLQNNGEHEAVEVDTTAGGELLKSDGCSEEGNEEQEREEEEDDDNDSVVTVQRKGSDPPPTLTDLCKCIKAVIGLAGVYNIADHFVHESGRGLEDISSMARAMYGQEHFDRFSPAYIVKNLSRSVSLPKFVFLHGTEDYVVPLTSTTKFGDALTDIFADVSVRIIPMCDHYELCLDLMDSKRKYYDSVMEVLLDTTKRVFN